MYLSDYDRERFPSLTAAEAARNGGNPFPSGYSRSEMVTIVKILGKLGVTAKIGIRPTGSLPYIVITETVDDDERKTWIRMPNDLACWLVDKGIFVDYRELWRLMY